MGKKSALRTKAKKNQKKKVTLFWPFGNNQGRQRGGIAQMVLLIIVLAGAFYMVGGFFPSNFLSQTQTPVNGVPAEITPGYAEESLQLGTIPFVTLPIQKCTNMMTVDLLLDRSGSMENPTVSRVPKIRRLQEAVFILTNQLGDDSIIGIQSFSGPFTLKDTNNNIWDDVPISFYKDVKGIIAQKINSLLPMGATPTHDALAFSYQKLQEAKTKFPDRNFNFIFITDGIPCPGATPQRNCPAGPDQDPRKYTPNPADQIKALGVNIYTLAIYTPNESKNPALRELLTSVATGPEYYFEANTGDDIATLLAQISNKICEEESGEENNGGVEDETNDKSKNSTEES